MGEDQVFIEVTGDVPHTLVDDQVVVVTQTHEVAAHGEAAG
jgi:hypothetical protein